MEVVPLDGICDRHVYLRSMFISKNPNFLNRRYITQISV